MLQEIRRDIRNYSEMFEAKDRLLQNRVSKEIIDKRREQMKQYQDYREHCKEVYIDAKPYRRELRSGKQIFLPRKVRYIVDCLSLK